MGIHFTLFLGLVWTFLTLMLSYYFLSHKYKHFHSYAIFVNIHLIASCDTRAFVNSVLVSDLLLSHSRGQGAGARRGESVADGATAGAL